MDVDVASFPGFTVALRRFAADLRGEDLEEVAVAEEVKGTEAADALSAAGASSAASG